MKIAIGGDHAGFDYKQELQEYLRSLGHEVIDFGPFSNQSVDYPDHAHPLANAVGTGEVEFGILICGSGNGVCIAANKHRNVRAALCWLPELAALSRQHNNANVLCIPARFVSLDSAREMLNLFLTTEFEGGRHAARVAKI